MFCNNHHYLRTMMYSSDAVDNVLDNAMKCHMGMTRKDIFLKNDTHKIPLKVSTDVQSSDCKRT